MKHYLLQLSLLFCLSPDLFAQELPRRVYLGIKMERISADVKRVMSLKDTSGVLISEVFNSSTAQKAGIIKGDILTAVNGKKVNNPGDVIATISGFKTGDAFTYELTRNNKNIKGKSKFQSYPVEKYAGLNVIYSESRSPVGLQRIILTKPADAKKKLPVIAFIGGIGCYSLDFPMDSTVSEVQLLTNISRKGFITARLEKPGMGDNAKYCKPCAQVSFTEETNGYVEAIKKLKLRDDVDTNSIFIFGHSMGGLFAPLVAKQTAVKGIIAYGTIGSNFIEYLAKTRRTIAEAYNMSPEETDDLVKNSCECAGYYFVDKMSTAAAAKKNKMCEEYLSIFDLRSREYNSELYSYNIPAVWKSFTGNALLLWGESDFVSAKEDHQIICNTVNNYHPGQAAFSIVKNADHGMNVAKNFEEAHKNPGKFNPEVSNTISEWLTRVN